MNGIARADIRDVVPDSALSGTIDQISTVQNGVNDVYRVESGNEAFILKSPAYSGVETFITEVRLLRWLTEHTQLPTADVLAYNVDQSSSEGLWVLMRCLPGSHPELLHRTYQPDVVRGLGKCISGFSPDAFQSLNGYGTFGVHHDYLHTQGLTWREAYTQTVADMLSEARGDAPETFESDLDQLLGALHEQHMNVPEEPRKALVLKDLRFENIHCTPTGTVIGLFDVERAAVGDVHATYVFTEYVHERLLDTETSAQLKRDLRQSAVDPIPADVEQVYRLGAVTREIRAFNNWWSDDVTGRFYEQQVDRVKSIVDDVAG